MLKTEVYWVARNTHADNVKAGWWTDLATGDSLIETRNRPEMLMLIVSELCEGIDGYERGIADDHLPQYAMEHVEIADAIIRIRDLLGAELSLGLTVPDELPETPYLHPSISPPAFEYHEKCLYVIRILASAMEAYRKKRLEEYMGHLYLAHHYLYHFYASDMIEAVISAKQEYNRNRADHKLENRKAEGGKKF